LYLRITSLCDSVVAITAYEDKRDDEARPSSNVKEGIAYEKRRDERKKASREGSRRVPASWY